MISLAVIKAGIGSTYGGHHSQIENGSHPNQDDAPDSESLDLFAILRLVGWIDYFIATWRAEMVLGCLNRAFDKVLPET